MSNVAWSGTSSGIRPSRVEHRMQIRVIITQVGLEPPDMCAGSICWKVKSFKRTQTENVERGRGPGQRTNPQALRLPNPCRRPTGLHLQNHDDDQKEEQKNALRR